MSHETPTPHENDLGTEALNRVEALRQEFQTEFPPILEEIRKDNQVTNQRVNELGDTLHMLLAKLEALTPTLETQSNLQPLHQMSHQGPNIKKSTRGKEKASRPSQRHRERVISVLLSSMDSGDDSPPQSGDNVDMLASSDDGSSNGQSSNSDAEMPARSHTFHFTFKVPDEKFGGDYRKLQSWLFNLDEYFSKARIKKSLQVDIATSNMIDDATIVTQYNSAFQAAFVECTDVSQAEALRRYISGLKPDTSDHVDLQNPSTLRQAMKIAEDYDNHKFNRSRQNADRPRHQGKSSHHKHKTSRRHDKSNSRLQDTSKSSEHAIRKSKLSWEDARSQGRCFRCGNQGHIKAQCPLMNKAKN
ncbi:hypothetical protein BJV82DRAFT_584548 [Fennellomyces sp. T-0311]|nr:hypothetical protein BJV82DRAFT_584548 [Fennellomyces sp. T-0311]